MRNVLKKCTSENKRHSKSNETITARSFFIPCRRKARIETKVSMKILFFSFFHHKNLAEFMFAPASVRIVS